MSVNDVVWKSVYSENVNSVAYDADAEDFYVQWFNGSISIYEKVPADVAETAARAYSVGSFIAKEIKPAYRHRYARKANAPPT